ncbi:galactose mutarotase [Candidatus Gracilibacteria bacterium]|nr:galactose mutarotase [Candidatus Gracilibacteria bacterium]
MAISTESFGRTADGRPVERYRLTNRNGLQAAVITYGGIITELHAPDRQGDSGDIVLGFDSLAPYLGRHPYFGALIGRFANRIAGGRFTLDGITYTLGTNQPPNHLHGGFHGFDKLLWQATVRDDGDEPALALRYHSPDGQEGYPGTVEVLVVYTLTAQNELRIVYEATTDRATIVNLTQHSYFNLAGHGDILGHQVQIFADTYLPVDDTLIPLGAAAAVAGNAFDLRQPQLLATSVARPELAAYGGYDHCFVLNGAGIKHAAHIAEASSGRTLDVYTTEPGLQLFTGQGIEQLHLPTAKRRPGIERYAGLCLEAQRFPDAPNRPDYPSTVLRPGDIYRQTTIYRFGVQ